MNVCQNLGGLLRAVVVSISLASKAHFAIGLLVQGCVSKASNWWLRESR